MALKRTTTLIEEAEEELLNKFDSFGLSISLDEDNTSKESASEEEKNNIAS